MNRLHGGKGTKLYTVWVTMKQRCYNPKTEWHKHYGGRGITVCKEWKDSFIPFRSWALANGYDENLSIDRINNDGNYEPSNCTWSTRTTQSRNTQKLRVDNSTGYRGVIKKGKRHQARIGINSKTKHIGTFDYPYTAAYAYDSYVIKHNLEHTRNFS